MVVLEAMAAGVPVAAARVGGVPDLVRHGENGLLFDPKDPAAMADAVREILTARPLKLASQGRAEALRRFHPKIIAARHLEIYGEVLAQKRPARLNS